MLVAEVQRALGVRDDGVFGTMTSSALESRGIERLDAAAYQRLTKRPPPGVFERCAQLTAAFEGHGYTRAAGNWDGAGATWGVIGFTLRSGSLLEVLRRIPTATLNRYLTSEGADQLRALSTRPLADAVAWGRDHSDPMVDPAVHRPGTRLIALWQDRFAQLGATRDAIDAQWAVAREWYWQPAVDALRALLGDEATHYPRALALAFDCHVQQGGFRRATQNAIAFADPKATLAAKLRIIATNQAEGAYADDIRARRMTIATGLGVVHGTRYDVAANGIPEEPEP